MNERIFKGEIAELKVQLRAAEKGISLSKPIVPARYDLIVDNGTNLERAQVKYGNGKDARSPNSVVVELRKWSKDRKNNRVYSTDEVDALFVYVPRIDKVLKFDTKDFCGKSNLFIHLGNPKNGQKQGILFAEDFIW